MPNSPLTPSSRPFSDLPDPDQRTPLLGGLSPREFMRDYWQRKPLLIRQDVQNFKPPVSVEDIRTLSRRDEVESRLVRHGERGWKLRRGPFKRLPGRHEPNWTLLVQGVDLHDDDTAALMRRFRFIPDARLDDIMISIASDGGGVGPHIDSYDVFLLQGHGRRRWRTSNQTDLGLVPGAPLKVLANFQPDFEAVLEPGDMLYLPPNLCHEGTAIGSDCMTLSIGFRAPSQATLARGMLESAMDQIAAQHWGDPGLYGEPGLPGPDLSVLYQDAGSEATAAPAALPDAMITASLDALRRVRLDEAVAARFLGQWLSSLPDNALFDPPDEPVHLNSHVPPDGALVLDRCTRCLYFGSQLFINGEVAPQDAEPALKTLANHRRLPAAAVAALGEAARALLDEWLEEGWAHWISEAPER